MSVSVNFKFGEGTLIGIGQNIGPRGGQDTQIVSSIFSSKGCCLLASHDGHSSGAGLGRGIHFSSYVNFTLTSIRAEVVSVTRLSAAHSSHTYSAPIMSPALTIGR